MDIALSLPFLPYGRQAIDEDDIQAVAAVMRGEYLTTGPTVAAFEDSLKKVTAAQFAIACANGTAALHLAAMALQLKTGDVVLVPAITFLATANAARYVGAEVVFADVDAETGLATVAHYEAARARAITSFGQTSVKAIFTVHLNGQTENQAKLKAFADQHSLRIVEDSCHALGTISGGASVGSCQWSDMATFSFHPVKAIAMGEGGAITTNDPVLAERLNRYRTHGMTRDATQFQCPEQALADDGTANPWYYEMPEVGFNYRASDINCALGLSQLNKLPKFIDQRRSLAASYDRELSRLSAKITPIKRLPNCQPVWHLYAVRIAFDCQFGGRAGVMSRLKQRGIGSQVHYLPVNRQPYYRARYGDIKLPGADRYYDEILSLPFFVGMHDGDVLRVVAALDDVIDHA